MEKNESMRKRIRWEVVEGRRNRGMSMAETAKRWGGQFQSGAARQADRISNVDSKSEGEAVWLLVTKAVISLRHVMATSSLMSGRISSRVDWITESGSKEELGGW